MSAVAAAAAAAMCFFPPLSLSGFVYFRAIRSPKAEINLLRLLFKTTDKKNIPPVTASESSNNLNLEQV